MSFGDGCTIDMFLGQWWANIVDLGQLYPVDHTKTGLRQIYKNNRFTDNTPPGGKYYTNFRDFLGTCDTGWIMNKFPHEIPRNPVCYFDEIMSGFEYALAATLIQYDMVEEGLSIVKCISNRYNGRLRNKNEVNTESNATVYGTGSVFGEDECGDFYGRPMSSWSVLLALQGFSYNACENKIGFTPKYMPHEHRSFFAVPQAWGEFHQEVSESKQVFEIVVKYGTLSVQTVMLKKMIPAEFSQLSLYSGNQKIAAYSFDLEDDLLSISFEKQKIPNGSSLKIELSN